MNDRRKGSRDRRALPAASYIINREADLDSLERAIVPLNEPLDNGGRRRDAATRAWFTNELNNLPDDVPLDIFVHYAAPEPYTVFKKSVAFGLRVALCNAWKLEPHA